MKKIIFFIEPEWAFGSIHYELCKYLFERGYNCYVLAWNRAYTVQEIAELDSNTHCWITTPAGYSVLKYDYRIDHKKISIVAHSTVDINEFFDSRGREEFEVPRNYGAVSEYVRDHSLRKGINREPLLCQLGINYHNFYAEPSSELRVVGYAGTCLIGSRGYYGEKQDIKRHYLVEEATKRAGLEFRTAQTYHNSFITMGGFYKNVDCVIIASTNEGAGLPSLEAGAAGKLVLSTPVGHWNQLVGSNGGIEMPLPENEFVEKCTEILLFYKNNPNEYRNRCTQIQEHAKSYDWSNRVDSWIELFK